MVKNKKLIFTVSMAVILLIAITGVTFAYLYSSNTKVNTFGIGENVSQVTETFTAPDKTEMVSGAKITKEVKVTNTGNIPSYTRVYVAISSSEFEDTFSIDWNTKDWTKGNDGYWYYNGIIKEGENTKPLMTTVTFNDKIENFTAKNTEGISIYEETVQAQGYSSAQEAFAAIN